MQIDDNELLKEKLLCCDIPLFQAMQKVPLFNMIANF